MSETSEMWKEFKGHGKLNAKEREIINRSAIEKWCNENDVRCKVIAEWQIRVYNDNMKIDVFPQSKKFHNITTNNRGQIKGKISDFLSNNFK